MKKLVLPCMLVISILTATAAQLSKSTLDSIQEEVMIKDTKEITLVSNIVEITIEEEDEAFDFNTKDYLPIGFDPYISFEEKYNIVYETVSEEADEPFDFNTKDYLPVGFNLDQTVLNSIVEIEEVASDEPFDFDHKEYLPVGFNPNGMSTRINEL